MFVATKPKPGNPLCRCFFGRVSLDKDEDVEDEEDPTLSADFVLLLPCSDAMRRFNLPSFFVVQKRLFLLVKTDYDQ